MLPFHLLPHHRPVRDSAETASEFRRVGEFILAVTFSTLGALIKARGDGSTNSHLFFFLDNSLLAILLSLASSALHLELHLQLRLPLARLFIRLAAFFTTAAVVLLITSSISPSLRWVSFAVSLSTFLFIVTFKLFPATLHYVAAVRRCRFADLLIGPSADVVDVQSPSYQSTSMSMPGQQRHGRSETPPLPELRHRISNPVRREQSQCHSFLQPSPDHIMIDIEALRRMFEIHTYSSDSYRMHIS